ncbi:MULTISPECIES: DUF7544 domain-containing protein [Halorubrum]|uniref:Uncharacterized protein n=1 Tax=Halorubrum hochstenium ATCC 700873 TaxID=1227481 RepID=M0F1Z5_9EURY|nr:MULTISPECIES: hypothetical protein [Halorubrum]ELZ54076.1 hypothetical protein C467_12063 [Halorubrum hochstenium ATCC 700873]
MNWYAVDALDRAIDATRRFLFPFEAVRWAKLAFLVLVMAGGTAGASRAGPSGLGVSVAGVGLWAETFPAGVESVPTVTRSTPTGVGTTPSEVERVIARTVERVAGLDDALVVAVVVGALTVGVALAACSVAFRLVFYDALATNEVALRRPFRARFRQALGLFGVTAALATAAAVPAVVFAVALDPEAALLLGVPIGGLSEELSTFGVVVLGGFCAVFAAICVLASRLTFELVSPTMVARETGVLGAWRRVWSSVRGSPLDVVVYLAIHAVVAAGVGFVQAVAVTVAGGVVGAVALVALVLAAVPLGGLGALAGTTAGGVVLVAVLGCAVAATAALVLPVLVVTRTYLISYEVSTLAGIDPESAPLRSSPPAPKPVTSDEREPGVGS